MYSCRQALAAEGVNSSFRSMPNASASEAGKRNRSNMLISSSAAEIHVCEVKKRCSRGYMNGECKCAHRLKGEDAASHCMQ